VRGGEEKLCRGRCRDSRQGTALIRSTARNRHSIAGTSQRAQPNGHGGHRRHAASSVARPTHGRGARICAAVAGCTRLTLVLWAGVEPWQTQRIYGAACNGARAALGAEGEGARERRAGMKILWRMENWPRSDSKCGELQRHATQATQARQPTSSLSARQPAEAPN
jgi:hypothetical protein